MIVIRPYTAQDSAQLSQAVNQVCADTPWMATRSFVPTNAWFHAMKMDDCVCHRLLVGEAKGKVIGWCRSFPVECEASSSRVDLGIGLLAPYRNQGNGTELILRSLEWAEAAGFHAVNLTVSPQNEIAVHVFEKCGFKTLKIYDNKMLMSICLS